MLCDWPEATLRDEAFAKRGQRPQLPRLCDWPEATLRDCIKLDPTSSSFPSVSVGNYGFSPSVDLLLSGSIASLGWLEPNSLGM
ncbi:MAG: hypothetical protein F6K55_05500 [Moorea sp. SIO4A3]|nr:hypothetical protein [Moorena sp. SIO4A3]